MIDKRLVAAAGFLVIAALACGGGGTSGGPTSTPAPKTLFKDDFSSERNGWGTGDDETASLQYTDDKYVFKILQTDWFIWGNPDQDDFSNIHFQVTAQNVGDATDPTFGVICNYQSKDAFYYLGIGPDGYYAIVRVDGEDDIFLTSDENLWILSDKLEINADQYVIDAGCGADGTLTLTVNGQQIDSATDTTYTQGNIGLFALSFEETPVEIHFDDVQVTELK